MRRLIFLLVATAFLVAVPTTGAMPTRAAEHGNRATAPAPDGTAPVEKTPTHRFTLVDESVGTVVRATPAGRVLGRLPGVTPLGTPTWLWALKTNRAGTWAKVVLPWPPNGRTGWVTLRGRAETHTRTWVQADLSRRRVMLMRGSHMVASFVAAVGASDSPTPIGRFSVTDPIATGDASGPFGWYAFGLSGHQPHLPPGWTGGDQLAIHGTNNPASLGTAASAGCLRVSSAALHVLKRALEPGTPVIIHP
jgi:lipoprotein-anchoring transpeptidase ErfK/SrfK